MWFKSALDAVGVTGFVAMAYKVLSSIGFSPSPMWKDPCLKCGEPTDYSCYLIDVKTLAIVLAVVLIVGSFAGFGPQIVKFVKTKQTTGVSFVTLLLGSFNKWSLLANFYMSRFPQLVALQNDFPKAVKNNLPQIAILVSFAGFIVPTLQYLFYQRKEGGHAVLFKRNAYLMIGFFAYLIMTLAGFLCAGLFFSTCDPVYRAFTLAFAIISCACACVQWVPQIWSTYKKRGAGSLAILGIAIQVPGNAITLVVLVLTGSKPTTWITNIAQLILQSILLAELVYFTCCKRRAHPVVASDQAPGQRIEMKDTAAPTI